LRFFYLGSALAGAGGRVSAFLLLWTGVVRRRKADKRRFARQCGGSEDPQHFWPVGSQCAAGQKFDQLSF
jgi:hypothetical protein